MRDQFINSQEILVILDVDNYTHVVDCDQSLHDITNVLVYCDENVVRFLRMGVENSPAFPLNSDDVTELIAWAWLNNNGEHPDDMKISGRGPWLGNSRALEEYIENYDDDRSDFDEHNTLNHRQQGITR